MITLFLEILSLGLLIIGSMMLIIGGIGMVRLPDVFSRMHGAGIIDTMGACTILLGLTFQAGLSIVTLKLVLIIVFIVFTSPTATHALARAALHGGARPQLGEPVQDDPASQGEASSKT